jgi:AcrR family transcriptional regulator
MRILDTALSLFNRNGIEGTSVAAICDVLAMSPGNLTYHFRRKVDIVLELEERFRGSVISLEQGMIDAISKGEKFPTPEEAVPLLRQLVELVWGSRFYIISFSSLHTLDREIVERFSETEHSAREGMAEIVKHSIQAGSVKELRPPNSANELADNIWYTIWGRILFHLMTQGSDDRDRPIIVRDCVAAVVALLEPYVSAEFLSRLTRESSSIIEVA